MTKIDEQAYRTASTVNRLRLGSYLICAAALSSMSPLAAGQAAVDKNLAGAVVNFVTLRQQVSDLHARAEHQAAIEAVNGQLQLLGNSESNDAAELLLMLGDAQMKAGQPKLAFASSEEAWKLRERLFGATDARTLDALTPHLEACTLVGSVKTCEVQAGIAVAQYEALGEKNAPGLAAMLRAHALLVSYSGRNAQAVALLDRAIAIWQSNGPRYEQSTLDALSSKAVLTLNLGQYLMSLG